MDAVLLSSSRRRRRLRTGGGPLMLDTFTREDNAASLGTTETGELWQVQGGGVWGVIDGMAYNPTPAAEGTVVADADVSDARITGEVDNASGQPFVIGRSLDGGSLLRAGNAAGTDYFQKRVAMGYTTLASSPRALAAGDRFAVQGNGNEICGYANETPIGVGPVTDAFVAGETKWGLGVAGTSGASNIRWRSVILESPS